MIGNPNSAMKEANAAYVRMILDARNELRERFNEKNIGKIELAIVLGSGLGPLADDSELEQKLVIPYSEIEGFPTSKVPGHAGKLIVAEYEGNQIILMAGRGHFYEYAGVPGWNGTEAMRHVTLPTRLLKSLGIEALLLSNAAGGLNPDINPPELMLCNSFLNKSGANPLHGQNLDLLGLRFPPMGGDECNTELAGYIMQASSELEINIRRGNYAMLAGPNYEFTGECQELQAIGKVDGVGMSTVPAILTALHGYYSKDQYNAAIKVFKEQGGVVHPGADYTMARRLKVAAITLFSNVIDKNGVNATDHEEVIENGKKGAKQFIPLVKRFVQLYHQK